MRVLLLVLVLGSILVSSTGNSFAQTTRQTVLGIYAQIEVQDSSGNLVAYIETPRVTIYYPDQLNEQINENMNMFKRSLVNVGGQNLEILQVNDTAVHTSPTIVTLNIISASTPSGKIGLAAAYHDGYPVVPGDKVTTYWTIIRSVS